MSRARRGLAPAALSGAIALNVGCALLIGVDEGKDRPPPGSGGAHTGGTGGSLCVPNAEEPCYDGTDSTKNVGLCKPGTRTCNEDGTGWDGCIGQVLPKPEDCSKPEDEDCNGKACSEAVWSGALDGSAYSSVGGVAFDAAGDLYVTGSFYGTFAFPGGSPLVNAGDADVFIAKLDPAGNHLWSRRYGDSQAQKAQALVVDPQGNVIVVGSFIGAVDFGTGTMNGAAGDMFVAKLDPTGKGLWSKQFHAKASSPIAVDPAGAVLVTGIFSGSGDLGSGTIISSGSSDAFIIKLTSDGSIAWATAFGGGDNDFGAGVAVDSAGSVFVTGTSSGTTTLGGKSLTHDGMFLFKLDATGNAIWAKGFAGSPSFISIATDALGSVFTAGRFGGVVNLGGADLATTDSDIFVAKHDGIGLHAWSHQAGAHDPFNEAVRLAVDPQGNAVVAGTFYSVIDFGGGPLLHVSDTDIFAAKLDPAGKHLWSKRYGNVGAQVMDAIATDLTMGDIALAGEFGGTIDFGAGTLTATATSQTFIARIAP